MKCCVGQEAAVLRLKYEAPRVPLQGVVAKPGQQTCSLSIQGPICRLHQLGGPAELYFDDGSTVLVQIKQRCRSSEYEGSAEVAWVPVLPLPH